ncbi:MAG: hypothetical protein AMS15_06765 [Planctomycetes bacterium DG_23]|nr:MAG: hypothetical protein AMS15_06765 [Planctomycetes bacterium DG_23]
MLKNSPRKVLIIGLDGATWKVLRPLMEEGYMPHLAKLAAGGARGTLMSILPANTAAAWSSFQTGVNPGKHGITNFMMYDSSANQMKLVSSVSIKSKTVWETISEQGRKTILINVPMTYPPRPIKGIVLSGILTPRVGPDMIYPGRLFGELKERLREYKILVPGNRLANMGLEEFINEQIGVEKVRFDLARHLLKQYEWDVFMVHNQSMDVVQHTCWRYLDRNSSYFDEKKFSQIAPFYEASDEFIHSLLDAAGPEVTVIIVSDHGFGLSERSLNLNVWLRKAGFLSVNSRIWLGYLKYLVKRMDWLGLRKRLIDKKWTVFRLLGARAKFNQMLINWQKTRAFTASHFYGSIYLNCGEGLKREIARSIVEGLRELKDPQTKKRACEAYSKWQIYQGPCLDLLPDVIVEPFEGYYCNPTLDPVGISSEAFPSDLLTGTHRREGIAILNGPRVRRSRDFSAHITDIAPTILFLLGAAIPEYMDGRALAELFSPQLFERNQMRRADEDQSPRQPIVRESTSSELEN